MTNYGSKSQARLQITGWNSWRLCLIANSETSWAVFAFTPLPEEVFIVPLLFSLACFTPFGFAGIS